MEKPLRKCIICGKEAKTEKELDLFLKSSFSKYGRQNKCKLCNSPPRPPPSYLRKCLTCGLEAHSLEELNLFIQSPNSKYKHLNRCKKCSIIRARNRLNNMTSEEYEKYKNYFRIWEKNNPIRRNRKSKKISFKKKTIYIDFVPRVNICSVCGKSYPNELKRQTDLHHLKYDENNPIAHTIELCISCHFRLHKLKNGKLRKLEDGSYEIIRGVVQ